jgi:hypothetical protein
MALIPQASPKPFKRIYDDGRLIMPPKILTAFKAAGEPITSSAALAAALAAFAAAAMLITPPKRVGIDWAHHQFMPREEQGPIVPEPPMGPSGMLSRWYGEFRPSIPDWPMSRR